MTDYEKLESLISEIDNLVKHTVNTSTPAFQAWFSDAERFIIKKFGQDSFEHIKLKETKFRPSAWVNDSAFVRKCKEGLTATKLIFQSYLSEMDKDHTATAELQAQVAFDKIFIVHGHDGELKQSVARLIEKQGIEAIILSEQVNQGRTVIEKFEKYSDVNGAICLFTADDLARTKSGAEDKPRARQNVVLEAGYFIGKLGRDHVILLADNEIEMPSDLSGIVYTSTDKWDVDVLRELKAIGYDIDFNKLF